ncbi:unnamed protein product [Didymodactylos carnosus]|uniref:NAD(P)(+)--arginine ADP-ribosyltransferase n=1 Tax=Didymodactylos carnosus TaxID=1234261 RepID=A0A8S2DA86_9BILA|nr:unnamed protein product [Didymodactylos carnosus]CAF3666448.1 unnamed protein product [Didymodactylos carnosus]
MGAITIWLDELYKLGSSDKNDRVTTHLSLCKFDPYLITIRDLQKCNDYISNLQEDKDTVLLIISSDTSSLSAVISKLLKLPQIESIYILCSNEFNTAELFEISSKVVGVYTHVEVLYHQLRQLPNSRRLRRQGFNRMDFNLKSLPPHNVNPSIHTTTTMRTEPPSSLTRDTANTKRQEAEFMYAQFLRDILIELDSTQEEMVKFCRQKCEGIETQLDYINDFDDYYATCNAIYWYTKDSFLYRLLNKALRDLDIDTLYLLRYFIKDLHLQLKQRHASQQQTAKLTIKTVYRGQLMNNDEFDRKIRNNLGGFFSVSSFFSTTLHQNVASVYAGDVSRNKTSREQSILFYIHIDTTINKFPYANISEESAFEGDEDEILFTMGAVFRIVSVDLDIEQGFYIVHLKLTGEEDEELKQLTQYLRKDVIDENAGASFAQLMVKMGHYRVAESAYLSLFENDIYVGHPDSHSFFLNQLGFIYEETGQPEKAREYHNKSLEIRLMQSLNEDRSLSTIYNNLGENSREIGNYEQALFYYNKALETEQPLSEPDQHLLALYHNNIGLVYDAQQRYSDALEMYSTSISIKLKTLPLLHPSFALTYNNMGAAYYDLCDYVKATEYFWKTLQIRLNSLQPDHHQLALAYYSLAQSLYKQGTLQEALDNMKKAYAIRCKRLSADDPQLIEDQRWILHVEKEIVDARAR